MQKKPCLSKFALRIWRKNGIQNEVGKLRKKDKKRIISKRFSAMKEKKENGAIRFFFFLVRRPRISFLIVKITSANFSLLSIHPFSLPHYAYNDASEVRNFRAYTFFRRFRNARRENQNDAIMVMPSDRDRLDGYGFLSNAACRMRKSHSFKSVAENRTSKKCLADRDLSLIHTMGNYS